MAPAHVRPAPKPAIATTSPGLTLPVRTASSKASGMLAADVLPYSARLLTTCRTGTAQGSVSGRQQANAASNGGQGSSRAVSRDATMAAATQKPHGYSGHLLPHAWSMPAIVSCAPLVRTTHIPHGQDRPDLRAHLLLATLHGCMQGGKNVRGLATLHDVAQGCIQTMLPGRPCHQHDPASVRQINHCV